MLHSKMGRDCTLAQMMLYTLSVWAVLLVLYEIVTNKLVRKLRNMHEQQSGMSGSQQQILR